MNNHLILGAKTAANQETTSTSALLHGRRQNRGLRRRVFCCCRPWGENTTFDGRAGAWPTCGGRRSGGYGIADLLKEGRSAMPLLPNDSCGTSASDATNWRNVLRP